MLLYLFKFAISSLQLEDYTHNELLEYLKMAENSYLDYNLDSSLYNFEYQNGLRAKVYLHRNDIVVAFKGTTLEVLHIPFGSTSAPDKKMVNALFSCCYSSEDCIRTKIETIENLFYLEGAYELVTQLRRDHPPKRIILTGHSLGGAVASLCALRHGLEAVTFSVPGLLYISKTLGFNISKGKILNIGMCNDPIFMGGCKGTLSICNMARYTIETRCHIGSVYCMPSAIPSNILSHRLSVLIDHFISSESLFKVIESNCSECLE